MSQTNQRDNEIMSQLVKSFKLQVQRPDQAAQINTLPGPKSYAIQGVADPTYIVQVQPGKWDQYDSHKYLEINIVKEYVTNRKHLPMPPSDVNPKVQELFMTLNLLRDDPDFIIEKFLFSKFKFSTCSFGPIKMKNGPELIDELISELKNPNVKQRKPLLWNDILEQACYKRVIPLQEKLIDKKDFDKIKAKKPIEDLLSDMTPNAFSNVSELFFTKAEYGFEILFFLLLDDQDDLRKNRSALLNPRSRLFGMAQITHKQFDFIGSILLSEDMRDVVDVNPEEGAADITTILYDHPMNAFKYSTLVTPMDHYHHDFTDMEKKKAYQATGVYNLNQTPRVQNPAQYILSDDSTKMKLKPSAKIKQGVFDFRNTNRNTVDAGNVIQGNSYKFSPDRFRANNNNDDDDSVDFERQQ